jgi:aminoglycoside phosphotransferase (APT) family kinase protein
VHHAEQEELSGWVTSLVGAPVTLERAVVRREGWIASAGDRRWFLRLGRDDDPANPPDGVVAEGRIVAALRDAGLLVPDVVAIRDSGAVLYGWMPGTADIDREPPEQQQDHLNAYMTQLARLHTLDLDVLGLDWMPRPATARESALAHPEAIYAQMGAMALEPLSTFGMQWLRNHVPDRMSRLSILHGDAGVGNFLVEGVTFHGIIDWEWAHIGDPMEDLGSVVMHAGFHPVGDLAEAFAHYEDAGGPHVDIDTVKYYAAHLYIRSTIALSAHVAHLDSHNPVALNLAYKLVNDRLTCDAIADALGISLETPDVPDDRIEQPMTMFDVVVANLIDDVVPAVGSEFARDRALMAARLTEALGRRAAWAPTIAAIECDELSKLLGEGVDDLDEGLRRLDDALAAWPADREVDALRYLSRRAVRAAWLARPVEQLFPQRSIARI